MEDSDYVGHSNLARTGAEGIYRLLTFLNNPAVLENLDKHGFQVDWQEVARIVSGRNDIIVGRPKDTLARK